MATMKGVKDERTCALLIGSGKCHPCQGPGKVKVCMKGGIKRSRIKNQDQEGAWAETDLSKMQHLLRSKRVADDDISQINYKERSGKKFANGSKEITTRIEQLFESDGKYYILYYTGHGDPNGSWVFPVTRRAKAKDGDRLSTAEGDNSPPTPQRPFESESGNDLATPNNPYNTAVVVVHEPIGITENYIQGSAQPRPTVAATVCVQESATHASTNEVLEAECIVRPPTVCDGKDTLRSSESKSNVVPSTTVATIGVQSNKEGTIPASMNEVPKGEGIIRPTTEVDGQPLLQDTMQSGLLQEISVESDEVKHKAQGERSRTDADFFKVDIPDTDEENELITFEDIIELWTRTTDRRKDDCFLMIISDCCHAGKWVQELDSGKYKNRSDICVQAACRSSEICKVSKDQQSSEFTRCFVEAHSLSFAKKVVLAVLDHAFVLNVVSIVRSNSEYSPISSRYAPFGQIEFYDSFDEMYLSS